MLGLTNISMKIDDGTAGWESEAPFDAIIVTAGAPDLPEPLFHQLVVGGRLLAPVGDERSQELTMVTKLEDGSRVVEKSIPCRFVKLIGKDGWSASA
jgi:protein-L-isoaspartate(D-aspartate) O-methyltransferase